MATEITNSTPTIAPKEGDVYRFTYSAESCERAKTRLGGSDLNWCFDGQLVYRNGRLVDTYWGLDGGMANGRSFLVAEAHAAGELRYVCNLNDVEKIEPYEFDLYATGDAFNLSHQRGCYKHFVRRIGAKKSPELMRAALDRKVREAQEEIRLAISHLEYAVQRREQLLPHIAAGKEVSI